jgi:hypothetical protein
VTASPPAIAAGRQGAEREDDEVTIVVRHAAIGETAEGDAKGKKTQKKAPPRARVPKPGKRHVGRR